MNFEVDFIGISEETCSADAICFRYFSEYENRYIIGVYDGGTKIFGKNLVDHLNKYYFKDSNSTENKIDFVICSHPDQDHASGLAILFQHFKIDKLYINLPWKYIDEIFTYVNDGRRTKEGVEKELKEKFQYIRDLEILASAFGTRIMEGFEGTMVSENIRILSPSKSFYLDLLIESEKTPFEDKNNSIADNLYSKIKAFYNYITETFSSDSLRENVSTSAENESSIIIHANMGDEAFLLTGDAGIKALDKTINYSQIIGIDLKQTNLYQIPHHGGRRNVSPSILNRLIGETFVSETEANSNNNRLAYVSVGTGDEKHPKKMVVNAFIRRGVRVCEVRSSTVQYRRGTPDREGWNSVNTLDFSNQVEDWDD